MSLFLPGDDSSAKYRGHFSPGPWRAFIASFPLRADVATLEAKLHAQVYAVFGLAREEIKRTKRG